MRNYEDNDNVEVVEFYELDQRNEEENIQLLWIWGLVICSNLTFKH